MKKTKGPASKNKRAQKLAIRKRATRRPKFTSKRDQSQKDFVRDFVYPQGVTPFGADLLLGMLAGFAIAGGFDRLNREEKCLKCGARRGEVMCDRALFEADACVFVPDAPVPQEGAGK